jgi:hypothetical protein
VIKVEYKVHFEALISDNVKPIILDKFNTIKLYVSDEYACIVSSDNPTIAIFKPNGRAMLKDAATITAAPIHPITSITRRTPE